MNVQKEISSLYNSINLKNNAKKISPNSNSVNPPAKSTSSTTTPNLQTEKLERSQNKRRTQINNKKNIYSSNKVLKDFSTTLFTEVSKGSRKNTLKKEYINDEVKMTNRNILTEHIDDNESMDNKSEYIDKVETTIKTGENTDKKTKSKNAKTAKSLTTIQFQNLGIGKYNIIFQNLISQMK